MHVYSFLSSESHFKKTLQAYLLLDELITAGEIQETSAPDVCAHFFINIFISLMKFYQDALFLF